MKRLLFVLSLAITRALGSSYLVQLDNEADFEDHFEWLATQDLPVAINDVYRIGDDFKGYSMSIDHEAFAGASKALLMSMFAENDDVVVFESDAIVSLNHTEPLVHGIHRHERGGRQIPFSRYGHALKQSHNCRHAHGDVGVLACQPQAPWHLARIAQRNLPLNTYSASQDAGGANVVVYVIDTGVDPNHPSFEGRMAIGTSFTGDGGMDYHGHGTHVAGLVLSRDYGVAKQAHGVAVQVLDRSGTGSWTNIVSGIQWALNDIQSKGVVGVINISIGGPKSDFVNSAVSAVVQAGVPVVVAAGNDASDASGVSPASAPGAICVGATDNTDALAGFSNFGATVTINAPGSGILSTWLSGYTAWLSGTSMASPQVAGYVALWQSINKLPPFFVRNRMLNQATKNVLVGNLPSGHPNVLVFTFPPAGVTC